jgi:hypothetical protein
MRHSRLADVISSRSALRSIEAIVAWRAGVIL